MWHSPWLLPGDVNEASQTANPALPDTLKRPTLGRSRGGLTSKIHLACDGRGRPLGFILTGGNTNDCTRFTAVMGWRDRTGAPATYHDTMIHQR